MSVRVLQAGDDSGAAGVDDARGPAAQAKDGRIVADRERSDRHEPQSPARAGERDPRCKWSRYGR